MVQVGHTALYLQMVTLVRMGCRLLTGTHQASGDSEGGLQDEDFSLGQYINNIDYMKQQFSAAK
jgi:hypothetical protein